jgi:hypothetical protein
MERSMAETSITTVEKYKQQLPKDLKIHSLNDYINAIKAIRDYYYPRKVLFRGLTDAAHIKDKMTPSLYRGLNEIYKGEPTRNQLKEHCENLLRKAGNLSVKDIKKYKDNEVRLLAHLQHSGAKTIFIDYTYNPLVALWFACHKGSKDNKKSCVAAIEKDVTRLTPIDKNCKKIKKLFSGNKIKIFEPPSINRRIISQQSVLLASTNGFIDKSMHTLITIPDGAKTDILEFLEMLGVHKKILFPDFGGFLEWFEFNKDSEIMNMIDKADRCYANFDYSGAIKLYKEALKLIG